MNIVSHGQKIQYTMCDRKFRYRDEYNADVQVAVLIADGKHSPEEARVLRSYRCPYCDGWHIGHDRKGNRR